MSPAKLITAIRDSDEYMECIFTNGSCYRFYLFLKKLYPKAEAYIKDSKDHIVTKIGSSFYDITGRIETRYECLYDKISEFEEQEAEQWSFRKRACLKLYECPYCDEPYTYDLRQEVKNHLNQM